MVDDNHGLTSFYLSPWYFRLITPKQHIEVMLSSSSSSFRSIMWIASNIIVLLITLQILQSPIMVDASSNKLAFFTKKKTYTPLLFFKVPKGTMDECECCFDMYVRGSELVVYEMVCSLYLTLFPN